MVDKKKCQTYEGNRNVNYPIKGENYLYIGEAGVFPDPILREVNFTDAEKSTR